MCLAECGRLLVHTEFRDRLGIAKSIESFNQVISDIEEKCQVCITLLLLPLLLLRLLQYLNGNRWDIMLLFIFFFFVSGIIFVVLYFYVSLFSLTFLT